MKTPSPRTLAIVATLFSSAGVSLARADAEPDFRAIAETIVAQDAGVKPGDLVVVTGDVGQIELVEEISVAVSRHGGQPLQLVGRERTQERHYTEVPAEYDEHRADFLTKLADIETAMISVESNDFLDYLRNVPASRLATATRVFRGVLEKRMKRGVRMVFVGNDLFPTDTVARRLGLTRQELAAIFWKALATSPRTIQRVGATVDAVLAHGKEVRVTHPNGSDLRFRIAGRPIISDGVVTPERASRGGAWTIAYLPAGEALMATVPDTADGTVVFGSIRTGMGVIEDLRWTFRRGKLVAHSARPSPAYTRWKAIYDAAGAGKDAFAGVDFGIHPGLDAPPGKLLYSYLPAGMVTLALGDDSGFGGDNANAFGALACLPGATVEIDGKPLVSRGVLQVEELHGP